MRRHWFLWLIVIVYAGYLLWPQLRAAVGLGTEVGTEVPSFQVQALNGDTYSSEGLRGQVVLINFWATWCPPCRTEMPGFEDVYQELHPAGLEILAISVDQGGAETVAEFARELGLSFPIVAEQQRLARAFDGTSVVPTSYLVDRRGHIRQRYVGPVSEEDLRAAVQALLAEPAPSAAVEP